MLATDERPIGSVGARGEARRMMEICNACRYCEGFCPVFPAMEMRRSFPDGDLGHLANLCHNCKGCWHACQYAPPLFSLPLLPSPIIYSNVTDEQTQCGHADVIKNVTKFDVAL